MSMFFNILSIGSYDADYQALLDRATTLGYTHPSTAQKTKQNQFVLDLKAANIWTALDILYVFATDGNSSFAQLNWKTPASYEITQVNTPTFTANEGFDFNGTTQYLNTNWNPGTNGVNFIQNNASVGIWINEAVSQNSQLDFGTSDGIAGLSINSRNASGNALSFTNDATQLSRAITTSLGLNMVQRRGASDKRIWQNGAQVGTTATTASTGINSTYSLYIGASNSAGTAASFSTRKVSMAFAGSSLSGLESSFYTAWNTYFTSL